MRGGPKGTELNMLPIVIKGIVHPKNEIVSLFTHCHVVTKPVLIYSCAECKRRY